jgi:hypothetical protein
MLAGGSLAAGFLGALTGLGGGVVIVPLLTLGFDVDMRYAISASLIAVIATSSGASVAYVREGYSNLRIGMFLEVATTIGAVCGALIAAWMPTAALAIIFGCVLLLSVALSLRPHTNRTLADSPDPLATRLRFDGTYPTEQGTRSYQVHHVPAGFGLMYIAGALSGLLGIGSGALKVLAMDQVMRIPFKVSTTTSNFMIGVTAAASAGLYFARGYIDPGVAMPVVLGVLAGALLGAKVLARARSKWLRIVFSLAVAAIGVQMIVEGMRGAL